MAQDNGFHDEYPPVTVDDTARVPSKKNTIVDRSVRYRFHPHFHPYVQRLVHELVEKSLRGLQDADTQLQLLEQLFTASSYGPTGMVAKPYPVKDLDFTSSGAYSVYNWELFFHVPIAVAIQLSRNQRFEEAQRWFHYIFDPTDSSSGPSPQRYWKVKPFRTTDVKSIEEILVNLATGDDPQLRDDTISSIGAWKDTPFRPHLVARYRPSAYMFKAVMAYLDNLIDWGDALFRQDTGESINEATQLYVLAANILGPRPQAVPRKGWQKPQTYASLRADLDLFGNAMREVEADIPFDLAPQPTAVSDDAPLSSVRSLGYGLYFCVPRNDRLIGYWDTVADRLFKIRNSLNIQGVFRQLPLFEPPIDPALLARAAAAGLDVGAVISGLNQPLPLVRFGFQIAKALEICQEVKSLGGQLLSAIEKQDGEALAIIRARHERTILRLAETVRFQQWQEAIRNREGVQRSLANAAERYTYYELLLGKAKNEIALSELVGKNAEELAEAMSALAEPKITPRPIEPDIAANLDSSGGKLVSGHERLELDRLAAAQDAQETASDMEQRASTANVVPTVEIAVKPMGAGSGIHFGGPHVGAMFSALAAGARADAGRASYQANQAAKIGTYARREQEWAFQSNTVAGEIMQIYKQLQAAQIREALAEREYTNHQKQIEHAEEIERFLTDVKSGKTTNQAFYSWLRGEVRGLYSQCFEFAFDVAKKAERALQHELGDPSRSFLQFGYLSGKQSLLAGEKLYLDIKRMEHAYHELNQREYELTKHVSLRTLGDSLLQLRGTGSCTITLPEELFDLDCPGHYFRRIKSVAVSIPCVVGPYASVNCTLTLLKSSIRTSPALGEDGYARAGEDSARFSDNFGSVQSIVTSTGINDSGLFEINLRDERYLPFEGAGAVSEWRLELPSDLPQFDHDTITDVILQLRYTAREAGVPLRQAAVDNLTALIGEGAAAGTVRLLSARQEFPTEWATFTAIQLDDTARAPLTLTLRDEHYPFWATKLGPVTLRHVRLFAKKGAAATVNVYEHEDDQDGAQLEEDSRYGGLLVGEVAEIPAQGIVTRWFDDNTMPDLWLALTWSAGG